LSVERRSYGWRMIDEITLQTWTISFCCRLFSFFNCSICWHNSFSFVTRSFCSCWISFSSSLQRQPITSHRVQSSVFSKESLEKWTSLERYLRQLPNLTNISQLTGHVACFTLMTTRTDLLCQARGEEETTSYHFPGICTVWLEYRSFGNHIMKPKALHMVQPSTLLWFAKSL